VHKAILTVNALQLEMMAEWPYKVQTLLFDVEQVETVKIFLKFRCAIISTGSLWESHYLLWLLVGITFLCPINTYTPVKAFRICFGSSWEAHFHVPSTHTQL
jgi:hypothetical protein